MVQNQTNQSSSPLSLTYSLPNSISHPRLDDILPHGWVETLYAFKYPGSCPLSFCCCCCSREMTGERKLAELNHHHPCAKTLAILKSSQNWMVVQHYCAEEHLPAQSPAAIAVGLDEQLILDEISNPSNLKYFSLSPFLSPSSRVAPKPTLFLFLCFISPRTWPYAKSVPSFERNGVCSNLNMREEKKALACCEVPLLKRKELPLTGYSPS